MSEQAAEKVGRYYDVRIPVGSSNVSAILLVTCRDCGAFVFNTTLHDAHHEQSNPPGQGA